MAFHAFVWSQCRSTPLWSMIRKWQIFGYLWKMIFPRSGLSETLLSLLLSSRPFPSQLLPLSSEKNHDHAPSKGCGLASFRNFLFFPQRKTRRPFFWSFFWPSLHFACLTHLFFKLRPDRQRPFAYWPCLPHSALTVRPSWLSAFGSCEEEEERKKAKEEEAFVVNIVSSPSLFPYSFRAVDHGKKSLFRRTIPSPSLFSLLLVRDNGLFLVQCRRLPWKDCCEVHSFNLSIELTPPQEK